MMAGKHILSWRIAPRMRCEEWRGWLCTSRADKVDEEMQGLEMDLRGMQKFVVSKSCWRQETSSPGESERKAGNGRHNSRQKEATSCKI